MKKILFFVFLILSFNNSLSEEIYNNFQLSNFYISPSVDSPIIYPLELGHQMVVQEKKKDWIKVIDNKTGLIGWVFEKNFSRNKPNKSINEIDFKSRFTKFKENVLEMSNSIEMAIQVKTFTSVRHLGGAAAEIIADDLWFSGRRHQNQAFQVYEIWKNINQSPSFLSFKDSKNIERFIVLSGPHRPRILKSQKQK